MIEQQFPTGWNEERVQKLLSELEARTDEEWAVADEAAAVDGEAQTVVTIPASLLPMVRQLLASYKSASP